MSSLSRSDQAAIRDLVELDPIVANAYRSLQEAAPLGLDAEPELWIIVDALGNPFECHKHSEGTHWVMAARNERDVLNAHAKMPDHHSEFLDVPGCAGRTTEVSLRNAILFHPDPLLVGWVIFDGNAVPVREERIR